MSLRSVLAPIILAALPAAAWAQDLTPDMPVPAMPRGFEAAELQQLDAWTVGALARSQGALDPAWTRSDAAFLAAVLDKLPAIYESPAALALARRVLLSAGAAPPGDAALAASKRFEALGRMGAADELATMAAGAGPALADPAIAQFAAQAELARGRRSEACQRGRMASADQPSAFLFRLRAYCAAAIQDRAAADLALELARGANAADAWYTGAIAAVGGAPSARPPAARYDNSLAAAISLAAGLRAGPNPLANSSTLALVTLARSAQAQQPLRAQAAAMAYRRGAISAAEARQALSEIPPEVVSGLPAIAPALRQVTAAPGSLEAATAIATLLRQASAPGDFSAAAIFFKDDIAALTAAPDPAGALAFARAALTAGDAPLARRLTQSARMAGIDVAAIAPLEAALAIAENTEGLDAELALTRRIDAAGASLSRAAARDVAILSAAGLPLNGAAQAFVLANPPQGGARADLGAMSALSAAVERGATGEVALLAVVALGDGPSGLDANSLAAIIRALRGVGLAEDARRVAIEALLAGPPAA